MIKRGLCGLIIVCMVLCMTPTAVFAADEQPDWKSEYYNLLWDELFGIYCNACQKIVRNIPRQELVNNPDICKVTKCGKTYFPSFGDVWEYKLELKDPESLLDASHHVVKDGDAIVWLQFQGGTAKFRTSESGDTRCNCDFDAPIIDTLTEGAVYCEGVSFGVSDTHLSKVSAVTATGEVTLKKGADGKYTLLPGWGTVAVVARDSLGNNRKVTVTMNDGHTPADARDCTAEELTCKYCDYVFAPTQSVHNWGAWVHGTDSHSRSCQNPGCTAIETEDCSGGAATCVQLAECSVCGGEYGSYAEHDFTAEKAEAQYLQSAATCTESAVYYKSCTVCGAAGAETFSYGESLNHDFGAWVSNGDGTHTRTCSHDAGHTETEDCSGGTATCVQLAECSVCGGEYGSYAEHDFTAEKAEAQYLQSAATCTESAVYYKSCTVCGAAGAETFSYGEPLNHDFGAWVSNGDGTHTRTCSRDAGHTETEDCSGGTANCLRLAKCSICGGEYGGYTVHAFSAERAEQKYLKSAVTCTESAVYYKSCLLCGFTGTQTFIHGEPMNHDFGTWTSNGNGTHTRICSRNTDHRETEDCSGGTATCVEGAKCTVCGGSHGERDDRNHTSLQHTDARAATQTAEGNTKYWHCTECGRYFADKEANKEITKAQTVLAKLEQNAPADKEKTPKTEDSGHVLLWIAILLLSGTAIAVTTAVTQKRRNSK